MGLLRLPQSLGDGLWALDGYPFFKELFCSQDVPGIVSPLMPESSDWGNGQDHFPKAIQILKIPAYRYYVLRGAVFSIGSKTDGTVRFSILIIAIHYIFFSSATSHGCVLD